MIDDDDDPIIGDPNAPLPKLLGLKILVVSLGVLMFVAVATLLFLLAIGAHKKDHRSASASTPASAGRTVPAPAVDAKAVRIAPHLSDGETVAETTLSHDAIALRISGGEHERIEVYDLASGTLIAVIDLGAEKAGGQSR